MTSHNTDKPFLVVIEVYNRGIKADTLSLEGFDTKELAVEYIVSFNASNNEPTNPDYYLIASPHNF